MNLEFRADGAHISGYVNVTEKKSRPVMTPHGKVVEEIEPRAFEAAINSDTSAQKPSPQGEGAERSEADEVERQSSPQLNRKSTKPVSTANPAASSRKHKTKRKGRATLGCTTFILVHSQGLEPWAR